ncbi:phosphatase inhibitor-domain-containing protein [Phellopilus nigrolimitatus]|nr:phosphatase inhibitor-domain-containing protein [Phellopilus nigrolimitatus]
MSYVATRPGPSTAAPADGSRTIVQHDSQPREARLDGSDGEQGSSDTSRVQGVLRLRGGPRSRPRVAWTEDVVDNEGMGKKKSKICCIYHKPRRFDESSSESSDSDADSDSGAGSDSSCGGRAQPRGRLSRRNHRHRAHRPHSQDGENGTSGAGEGQAVREAGESETVQGLEEEPNAYERQPPPGKGKKGKERGSA